MEAERGRESSGGREVAHKLLRVPRGLHSAEMSVIITHLIVYSVEE